MMFGRNAVEAPVRGREDPVYRTLLQEGDVPGVGLIATWLDVAPGFRQGLHDHDAERDVERGNPVHIPSGAVQGIENMSGENLAYVSAATPVVSALAAYDTGQLRAKVENEEEA